MKVYTKSVRSTQPQSNATAIMTETGKELFRVNYWDNRHSSDAADKAIADWMKAHPQYTMDDHLSFINN